MHGRTQKERPLAYGIDAVFCIDATDSMRYFSGTNTTLFDVAKEKAITFCSDFSDILLRRCKRIGQTRIRVIGFRDYLADGNNAMLTTRFFDFPQESEIFTTCINTLHSGGGGDFPEDGLEALAYAIKSPWTNEWFRKYRVIFMWSDAIPHEIGYGRSSPHYPKGMAKSISELHEWWDNLRRSSMANLVLFTPDEGAWKEIGNSWENVMLIPYNPDMQFSESTFEHVLNMIASD